MKTYHINFQRLAKELLPHFLQKSQLLVWVTSSNMAWITGSGSSFSSGSAVRHLKWLGALLAPMQALNQTFQEYVSDVRYTMYLTGQVIYLEHYLNDLYDPIARRIYIEDGEAVNAMLVRNKSESGETSILRNKSEGQESAILYNRDEVFGQDDFVVVLPFGNLPDYWEARISASINRYKAAGKRYRFRISIGGPLLQDLNP